MSRKNQEYYLIYHGTLMRKSEHKRSWNERDLQLWVCSNGQMELHIIKSDKQELTVFPMQNILNVQIEAGDREDNLQYLVHLVLSEKVITFGFNSELVSVEMIVYILVCRQMVHFCNNDLLQQSMKQFLMYFSNSQNIEYSFKLKPIWDDLSSVSQFVQSTVQSLYPMFNISDLFLLQKLVFSALRAPFNMLNLIFRYVFTSLIKPTSDSVCGFGEFLKDEQQPLYHISGFILSDKFGDDINQVLSMITQHVFAVNLMKLDQLFLAGYADDQRTGFSQRHIINIYRDTVFNLNMNVDSLLSYNYQDCLINEQYSCQCFVNKWLATPSFEILQLVIDASQTFLTVHQSYFNDNIDSIYNTLLNQILNQKDITTPKLSITVKEGMDKLLQNIAYQFLLNPGFNSSTKGGYGDKNILSRFVFKNGEDFYVMKACGDKTNLYQSLLTQGSILNILFQQVFTMKELDNITINKLLDELQIKVELTDEIINEPFFKATIPFKDSCSENIYILADVQLQLSKTDLFQVSQNLENQLTISINQFQLLLKVSVQISDKTYSLFDIQETQNRENVIKIGENCSYYFEVSAKLPPAPSLANKLLSQQSTSKDQMFTQKHVASLLRKSTQQSVLAKPQVFNLPSNKIHLVAISKLIPNCKNGTVYLSSLMKDQLLLLTKNVVQKVEQAQIAFLLSQSIFRIGQFIDYEHLKVQLQDDKSVIFQNRQQVILFLKNVDYYTNKLLPCKTMNAFMLKEQLSFE